MKKVVILILLAIILIPQVGLAATKTPFTIDAEDYVIFDEETEIIQAEGNVNIKLDSSLIRADKIQVDIRAKLIKAEGNVILIEDKQKITGDALEYDYQQEQGKFFNAQSEQDEIKFRGKVINIIEDEMVIEDTVLTPCNHPEPHYKLTADKITVHPNDKLVATGVYLWIKDYKVLPLPTYTMSLGDSSQTEGGQKQSIPEPKLGYNGEDGLYFGVDYDHYINESLEGHIYAKAASKKTNRINIDYTYHPSDIFKLNSRVNYDQRFGLDTGLKLTNKFGDTVSEAKYDYYIEDDKEKEDYRKRKWLATWNLNTDLLGVDTNLYLKQDYNDQKIEEKITFSKEWSDYYWKVTGGKNININDNLIDYKPQLSLGMKNKDLGNGTLLSTSFKVGKINEQNNQETTREQINVKLENEKLKLTDSTDLYWLGKMTDAYYRTGDNYRTYDLGVGLKQELGSVDINLDYQYYNELGTTPFEFDSLTSNNIGQRQYLSGSIGSNFNLTDSFNLSWSLSGGKRYYETGDNYSNYGLVTGIDYQINEFNRLELDYNYQSVIGTTPLKDEKIELANELTTIYQFQTNEQKFPYWDVKVEAGYEFNQEELSKLNYSFTREFDCFNTEVSFDQLEEEVNFRVNIKY